MTQVDLSTFDQVEQINQESLQVDAVSLYQAFEQVKDGRGKKGKRYPLALILTLVMLGKMVGQPKIEGTITWINERKQEMKRLLNWPKSFPSHKTYITALSKCDGEEIARVVAQVITKARTERLANRRSSDLVEEQEQIIEKPVHRALDGKKMRGTMKHENENQPEVNTVALYEVETGIVIAQKSYKNGHEQSTGLALLHPLLVKGCIVTTDALHSYRKFCKTVDENNGFYMALIKDNNPAVRRRLVAFFENEQIDRKEWQYHKDVKKGHGRLEVREIWTSTQMNQYFKKEWASASQIFMIRRTVTEKDEKRVEVVYGITNLPRKKANADRLLELNRKHWHIENRLHYRRDVTLGEDASQVRMKGAPPVLAALNGGILALSDFCGIKNLTKQMIHYCAQPQEALQLLLGNLSMHNG
jgi:predicted transposase YbfD/YdcC